MAQGGEERTNTVVKALGDDDRVQELMLMLGAHSAAGRSSVVEMLTEVAQVKAGTLVLQ